MSNAVDTRKNIIIIGAGIAGLAAGCYAQMNGYQTEIFELHDQPGGLCTAWQRQGYTFDGCLYYLFGSGQGQPFHQMWEELGAVQGREFVHHDEFMRVVASDGKTLVVYSNLDRLEAHLKALSPIDSLLIEEFCDGLRAFTRFDMSLLYQKPRSLMSIKDWMQIGRKLLPFVAPLANWGSISAEDFANEFQDPFLRRAIPQMFSWSKIPVMVGMSLIAYAHNQNAGVPIGGSLEFAKAIAQRYLDLGGKIHYNAQVEKILVQNHQAIGVRLYRNDEYYADRVIAACDGRGVIFDLLRDYSVDHSLHQLYDGHLPVHSQLQVSLGVNRDFTHQPHWVTYLLDQPMTIAGETHSEISVKHYCSDRSLAPPGKSVLTVMLTTSYDYWQRIYGRSLYHHEETQEASLLIGQLEQFYPGIKSEIEAVDVATPLTYERYTGNWQGSSCGWLLTKQTLPLLIKGIPKTISGLHRFYMIGQWAEPGGGVPIVAMSGRTILQQICHEDRKVFRASFPC
ncbi:MAG: NAD(P)/FAD-dependent oxidoreductase [Leptolyngbyaceae cyanobacterium CSU_1_3]|nr:NAD(P)/FAD-dependent oxidoreductase [Leptolyngbyaceae cyanobacterium CSU_1_3]